MERRDSTTSSTFAAVETPRTVALHVLELLGHMTKANSSTCGMLKREAVLLLVTGWQAAASHDTQNQAGMRQLGPAQSAGTGRGPGRGMLRVAVQVVLHTDGPVRGSYGLHQR